MDDQDRRNHDGRLWARLAIAELTTAINEAASLVISNDDRVVLSYVGNARSAIARADENMMRAKMLLNHER
jgi:hypothetical protein